MQLLQFSERKNTWLLPVFTVCLLLGISSCKGKKANSEATCVKLTKKQIEKWVDKGYTDPKNANYMASVEFHTAYSDPGDVFRVFAIGRDASGKLLSESLTELSPVDSCLKSHIHLKQFIFVGTVPATLEELEILNESGKVRDSLTYLRMFPYTLYETESKFDVLAYTGHVHTKSASKQLYMAPLPPCPPCPNCKGPCPPPSACPPGCYDKTIDRAIDQTVDKPIDTAANQ